MFFITENNMIIKQEPSNGDLAFYSFWWRKRGVYWPALLNVRMPKKFYTGSRKKRYGWLRLVDSNAKNWLKKEDIDKIKMKFQTENVAELIAYICKNEFPEEVTKFLLKMV